MHPAMPMSTRNRLAPTPPMGWNSWIGYGATVTEAEVEATAAFMSKELRELGWEYVVVDGGWSLPGKTTPVPSCDTVVTHHVDPHGRFAPDPHRFPSSADGAGFAKIADSVHRKGLKFGVHMMRGIPRQAVRDNTPIFDSGYHAHDIADTNSICAWSPDMYGIDMSRPGAQSYYDSVVSLYAGWGVDYIKADDMSSPYHAHEIEALSLAIERSGRNIVLSSVAGQPLARAEVHRARGIALRALAHLGRLLGPLGWRAGALLDAQGALRSLPPHRGIRKAGPLERCRHAAHRAHRTTPARRTRSADEAHPRGADDAHEPMGHRALAAHDRGRPAEPRSLDALASLQPRGACGQPAQHR